MESIWKKTCKLQEYPCLNNDIECDVCVIGGGITGILTAFLLQERGKKVVVLERDRIGSGATGNTTAKITSQHGIFYDRLIKTVGKDYARQYANAHQNAIEDYRNIINRYNISCSFEEKSSFVYSVNKNNQFENELKAAKLLGLPVQKAKITELPFTVADGLELQGQAQFHPLEFLKEIAKDLDIYEKTLVLRVENQKIYTDCGNVLAHDIVFAAHFPFVNFPGMYFMRMHQSRSYVLALKNAGNLNGMYLDCGQNGLSFRSYNEYLLLGGMGHRTGKFPENSPYDELRKIKEKFYPESEEFAFWSAQDCMPHDGMPFIGRYSRKQNHWYVASGFKKWGMTGAMTAARIISSEICGESSQYAEVFSPARLHLRAGITEALKDTAQTFYSIGKEKLEIPKEKLESIPKGSAGVIKYNGEKVGVYRSENGENHFVTVRCPHLGCRLEWNSDEKSWDCPCHGSRFDFKGNLLDNPAQNNISK